MMTIKEWKVAMDKLVNGSHFAAETEENKMTVKEVCKTYKLSQTALAKRFGIPLRTVQAWCLGERTAPDYVVGMMIEILEKDEQSQTT